MKIYDENQFNKSKLVERSDSLGLEDTFEEYLKNRTKLDTSTLKSFASPISYKEIVNMFNKLCTLCENKNLDPISRGINDLKEIYPKMVVNYFKIHMNDKNDGFESFCIREKTKKPLVANENYSIKKDEYNICISEGYCGEGKFKYKIITSGNVGYSCNTQIVVLYK